MENKEPYRATRLWNEVIHAFRSGMPVKKHRRRMMTYNDCFMASEAVTWLHCYLLNNPNFGIDVTRKQTVQLLQKFLKCHVIESAIFKSKKHEFGDNSHLYSFTQLSPRKLNPCAIPLSIRNKNEDRKEKDEKTFFKKQMSPNFFKENLPECYFVEKQLPLEKIHDIWKNVALARLEKLLPSEMSVSDILDAKCIDGKNIKYNATRLSKTGVVSLIDKTDDIPPWVLSAMKCLTNWPNASGSGSCLPNYPGFERDVFNVVKDFFINPQVPLIPPSISTALLNIFYIYNEQSREPSLEDVINEISNKETNSTMTPNCVKTSTPVTDDPKMTHPKNNTRLTDNTDGKILLDDPDVMWDYPSTVYFETAFTTTNPVTRIVNSPDNLSKGALNLCGSIESMSTISICSAVWEKSKLQMSHESLNSIHSSSRHSLRECLDPEPIDSSEHACLDTSISSIKTVINMSENLDEPSTIKKSAQDTHNCTCSSAIQNSSPSLKCSEVKGHNVQSRLDGKIAACEDIIAPFQIIFMFLPPPNRRQLHLLFRMINKILKNGKFVLNVNIPMRDYLLEMFLPAMVQLEHSQDFLKMFSFILDDCETFFQPSSGLKDEAEFTLSRYSSRKIKYSLDDTCFLTYCELVSKQQYEAQKVSASEQALINLLDAIIQDDKITEKDRKKKLKQFKENHPEVYFLRFPQNQKGAKPKKTLLNKLVNLRI